MPLNWSNVADVNPSPDITTVVPPAELPIKII